MEPSKQGVIVLTQNPIEQLQLTFKRLQNEFKLKPNENEFKHLQNEFKAWLSKPPLLVEASVVTFKGAVVGAIGGAFMDTIYSCLAALTVAMGYQVPSFLNFGPLHFARNIAVWNGVNDGITFVMKGLRGKEDVQSKVVASFGAGATLAYDISVGPYHPAFKVASAVTLGLLSALLHGGIFQSRQEKVDDTKYVRARAMLYNLGLHSYEKHFHRGLLTDNTLPLLTERELREVKIPPGPRLLILDHIQKTCFSSENCSS